MTGRACRPPNLDTTITICYACVASMRKTVLPSMDSPPGAPDNYAPDDYAPSYSTRRSDRLRAGRALQQSPRRAYSLIRSAIRMGDSQRNRALVEDILVRELGTSRNAVRLALQKLDTDGIIKRRPRHGTVVVSEILEFPVFECSETTEPTGCEFVKMETRRVPTSSPLASRLNTDSPTLSMTEFSMHIDGLLVGIFVRYGVEDVDLSAHPSPRSEQGYRGFYRRIYGQAPGRVQVAIEATGADDRTAKLLGIDAGHPLLVRETLYCDTDLHPRELHYTYFDSRRCTLRADSSAQLEK